MTTNKNKEVIDLVDEVVQSYPKLLELICKVNLNLIEFIKFLNESGIFYMIADDKDSKDKLDNFMDNHQGICAEMGNIVNKIANKNRPN